MLLLPPSNRLVKRPTLLHLSLARSVHDRATPRSTTSLTSSPLSPPSKSASPLPTSNPSATQAPSPTPVPSRPPSVNPGTLNFNLSPLSGSSTQPLRLSSGSQAESWSAQTGGLPWLNLDVMSGTLNPGQTQLINVTVNPTTLVPGTYPAKITINLSSGRALTVPVTLTVV